MVANYLSMLAWRQYPEQWDNVQFQQPILLRIMSLLSKIQMKDIWKTYISIFNK